MKKIIVLCALSILFFGCKQQPTNSADAIYFGGDIITMEGDSPNYAEAVAIKNGKILFVGTKTEAEKMKGDSTNMIDLQGKTLLPGFVDGHSHFSEVGLMNFTANLLSPPDGQVKDIPQLTR